MVKMTNTSSDLIDTSPISDDSLTAINTAVCAIESAATDGDPLKAQALTFVRAAADALTKAQSPRDLVAIRDRYRDYETVLQRRLKRRKDTLLESNHLVAIRLRIERAIGALIAGDDDIHRGGPNKEERITLASKYGVSKYQSYRFQQMASVDDQDFELWVSENIETTELSAAWLVNEIRDVYGEGGKNSTLEWYEHAQKALDILSVALSKAGDSHAVALRLVISMLKDILPDQK
jgi:hypothetical protein